MKKYIVTLLLLSSLSTYAMESEPTEKKSPGIDVNSLVTENHIIKEEYYKGFKHWISAEPGAARSFLSGCGSEAIRNMKNLLHLNIARDRILFIDRVHIKERGMGLQQLPLGLNTVYALWKNAGEEQKKVFDECSHVKLPVQVYACGDYNRFGRGSNAESKAVFKRALLSSLILSGKFNPDVFYEYKNKDVHFIHLAREAGDLEVVEAAIDVIKKNNPERGALFEQSYLPGRITERMMAVLMNSLRPKVPTESLLDLAGQASTAGEGSGWNAQLEEEAEELFSEESE